MEHLQNRSASPGNKSPSLNTPDIFRSLEQFCSSKNLSISSYKNLFAGLHGPSGAPLEPFTTGPSSPPAVVANVIKATTSTTTSFGSLLSGGGGSSGALHLEDEQQSSPIMMASSPSRESGSNGKRYWKRGTSGNFMEKYTGRALSH